MEVSIPGLRPNSKIYKQEIVFFFNYSGLGDYIHWVIPIQWMIETNPHLHGTIYAPKFFFLLAQHWFKKYEPRFTVKLFDKKPKEIEKKHPAAFFLCPDGFQMATPTGFHLLTLGFHYFCNLDSIPKGWEKFPEINGDEVDISKFNLPEKYCVVTTESTSEVRTLKGETINGITSWAKLQNITPVFLGKKELQDEYKSWTPTNIDFEGVIDLREQTNLLEAACVLAKAQFVAGLDNGLLHLASCSMVPVAFGFTTVDPRHRMPPRREGAKSCALGPHVSVTCRFCQSNVRGVPGWDYRKCLYGDKACIESLTADRFIAAIKSVWSPC